MATVEEKIEMPHKTSISDEIKSVTITAKEELRRRAELQAIRRELLALAEQDGQLRKQLYDHKEKLQGLASRVLALLNN